MGNIIVVGAGMMGMPIIWAMSKLGHGIYVVDKDIKQRDKISLLVKDYGLNILDVVDDLEKFDDYKVDLVISSAPFSVNPTIVYNCIANKRRYCDLGGNPYVSEHIQDYYRKLSKYPCMTDLGLAPGLTSLLCCFALKKISETESVDAIKGSTIEIRVGGLPVTPNNTLKYNAVFNLSGLYNEYTGKCSILRDGQIVQVNALDDLEILDYLLDLDKSGLNPEYSLEAFHTRGGLGNIFDILLKYGVLNCDYKTIRYCGHLNGINFLFNECKLDQKDFCRIVSNACPQTTDDMVLLSLSVKYSTGHYVRRCIIKRNEMWTAMQQCTAFPAAAVADMIANGEFDGVKVVNYSDVDNKKFFKNMETLRFDTKSILS